MVGANAKSHGNEGNEQKHTLYSTFCKLNISQSPNITKNCRVILSSGCPFYDGDSDDVKHHQCSRPGQIYFGKMPQTPQGNLG